MTGAEQHFLSVINSFLRRCGFPAVAQYRPSFLFRHQKHTISVSLVAGTAQILFSTSLPQREVALDPVALCELNGELLFRGGCWIDAGEGREPKLFRAGSLGMLSADNFNEHLVEFMELAEGVAARLEVVCKQ